MTQSQNQRRMPQGQVPKLPTNEKSIPHIPLPFEEVMKDVLKVKPPEKRQPKAKNPQRTAKI
jgi:hypothetical protein